MDVVSPEVRGQRVRGFTVSGAPRRVLGLAAIVSLALLMSAGLTGCQRVRLLEHTLESPEAVAGAVLRAFNAGDRAALETLSLTEHEFRKLVWPKLPASRPGRNIPWDYVWKDLHGKSAMQLTARLNEWQREDGGTVMRVEFAGDTSDYETYRVRRKSVVVLKTAAGEETRARWFGSIIEQDGRYKVFSYVVD
jgi:hypothetical protein